ncbi:hypothetical protein Q3G72_004485 [Acer saccharum]|nr:hypothetical protein Q3G72_004485 [Acer saccharum]
MHGEDTTFCNNKPEPCSSGQYDSNYDGQDSSSVCLELSLNTSTSRRRFDRGRLLVLISHDRPCPRKIKVDYGEGSFSLKIIEDGMPMDLAWLENHLGLIKILQHANLKVVQTKGGAVSMDSKVSGNVASLADEGVSGDVSKSDQLIGVCPLQCYGKPKVIGKRAIKGKASEFKGESNLLASRSNNIGCLDRSVAEKSRFMIDSFIQNISNRCSILRRISVRVSTFDCRTLSS